MKFCFLLVQLELGSQDDTESNWWFQLILYTTKSLFCSFRYMENSSKSGAIPLLLFIKSPLEVSFLYFPIGLYFFWRYFSHHRDRKTHLPRTYRLDVSLISFSLCFYLAGFSSCFFSISNSILYSSGVKSCNKKTQLVWNTLTKVLAPD